ncbi:Os05g0296050 [Oryza sativa Japonica Group]|jgi:hypothetical protein|uniref:Os05g0296050 protein n=1 Tax=Oryza sativa subsp. japonica TaxID=39947 RepID=A0A0P0WKF6_ORYSJ|nr:Os05g0296050 [Oryza sativa Japonica Group]
MRAGCVEAGCKAGKVVVKKEAMARGSAARRRGMMGWTSAQWRAGGGISVAGCLLGSARNATNDLDDDARGVH